MCHVSETNYFKVLSWVSFAAVEALSVEYRMRFKFDRISKNENMIDAILVFVQNIVSVKGRWASGLVAAPVAHVCL